MRKKLLQLKGLKNSFSNLLCKFKNEIFVFVITCIIAFLVIVIQNLSANTKSLMLIKDNDLLMLENLNMKVINSRQDALIKQQQEYINELEKLKRAVLEGNYINHETNKDTKQRNGKVVGEGA